MTAHPHRATVAARPARAGAQRHTPADETRFGVEHVERLLREKETLMRVSRAVTVLRPELQR